jgi:hypothetical protein
MQEVVGMRRSLLALLLVSVLVLTPGLTACGDSQEPEESEPAVAAGADEALSEPPVEMPEEPLDTVDFSDLTGTWTVSTVLTEIDNQAMTPAADQPGATYEWSVSGDSMTMLTDEHRYEGLLMPEDDGWVYHAVATYVDETGTEWTSTIELHGMMVGDDAFSGELIGTIDSASEGHLYTAHWDIEGVRQ